MINNENHSQYYDDDGRGRNCERDRTKAGTRMQGIINDIADEYLGEYLGRLWSNEHDIEGATTVDELLAANEVKLRPAVPFQMLVLPDVTYSSIRENIEKMIDEGADLTSGLIIVHPAYDTPAITGATAFLLRRLGRVDGDYQAFKAAHMAGSIEQDAQLLREDVIHQNLPLVNTPVTPIAGYREHYEVDIHTAEYQLQTSHNIARKVVFRDLFIDEESALIELAATRGEPRAKQKLSKLPVFQSKEAKVWQRMYGDVERVIEELSPDLLDKTYIIPYRLANSESWYSLIGANHMSVGNRSFGVDGSFERFMEETYEKAIVIENAENHLQHMFEELDYLANVNLPSRDFDSAFRELASAFIDMTDNVLITYEKPGSEREGAYEPWFMLVREVIRAKVEGTDVSKERFMKYFAEMVVFSNVALILSKKYSDEHLDREQMQEILDITYSLLEEVDDKELIKAVTKIYKRRDKKGNPYLNYHIIEKIGILKDFERLISENEIDFILDPEERERVRLKSLARKGGKARRVKDNNKRKNK